MRAVTDDVSERASHAVNPIMSPSRFVVVDMGNSHSRFVIVEPSAISNQVEPRMRFRRLLDEVARARDPNPGQPRQFIRHATSALTERVLDEIALDLAAQQLPWHVGSVQDVGRQRLFDWFQQRFTDGELRFLARADFPMEVHVREPQRLGIDRLASAFAAGFLKPDDHAAVVIDAGTAITIDAVAVDRGFLGGCILPGIELSRRALAQGTSQLPVLPVQRTSPTDATIGLDTEQAIERGVFWGCVGAISLIVHRVQDELHQPTSIYLTGGSARYLFPHLTFTCFLEPDLVLAGLAMASLV